ncbi:MAG: EAL domain-containing protein [Pseudomonadota bacterium]
MILGDWFFTPVSESLTLSIDSSVSPWRELSGTWSLSDFRPLLDGLSYPVLITAFRSDQPSIAATLTLATGEQFNLTGVRDTTGVGRGVLVKRSLVVPEADSDGPQLMPVYQPIFDLITRRVVGFEALARWQGADTGQTDAHLHDVALAPNMLLQACQALSDLRRARPELSNAFMHVNLTAADLAQDGLVPLVTALIEGFTLEPGALRLELTEQAALRNSAGALVVAKALREAGVALVLDDFGSGHSSFLWLAQLPVAGLKIDSSLIARWSDDKVKVILASLTKLAGQLGLTVTAEGIEHGAMVAPLAELGFQMGQGFALARPATVKQLLETL